MDRKLSSQHDIPIQVYTNSFLFFVLFLLRMSNNFGFLKLSESSPSKHSYSGLGFPRRVQRSCKASFSFFKHLIHWFWRSNVQASTFDIVAAEQLSEQHQPDVTSGVDPLTTTSTGTGTSSLSSPTSSSRSSPAPSSTTSPSSSTHKSSHGGVIAGAVIGSLAGVACVLLAIYFYIRYRRQKKPRRYFEGNYEKNASMLNVDGQSAVVPAVSYPPLKLYVRAINKLWLTANNRH